MCGDMRYGCRVSEAKVQTKPNPTCEEGTYGLVVAPGCVRDDRNEKLLEHGCTRHTTSDDARLRQRDGHAKSAMRHLWLVLKTGPEFSLSIFFEHK